jgi:hypothetical protein
MKYILSVFTCFAFVAILSCNKKDDAAAVQTKAQLITSGTWKIDNLSFKSGSIETPLPVTACLTDNVITFRSDNTGTMTEGTDVCAGSQPTSNFTWAFVNNETAINITGASIAGISGQFKLVDLSDTRLALGRDTTISTFSGTFIANFKH